MPTAIFLGAGQSVYLSNGKTYTAASPCYYVAVEGSSDDGTNRQCAIDFFYLSNFSVYVDNRGPYTGEAATYNGVKFYAYGAYFSATRSTEIQHPDFQQIEYYSSYNLSALAAETCANHFGEVTGITLNETDISLYPGETFQFVATVEGTGNFDASVFYSLISIDPDSSTEIGQSSGLLYIDPNETKSLIQILAQSVENPDVGVIANITIIDPKDPDEPDGPGGEGGGGETPDPVPDIKPVYRRVSGQWVKLTAYQRMDGEWVLISTAGG